MKRHIFLTLCLALLPLLCTAQATDSWTDKMKEIAANNLTLRALKSRIEAQTAANSASLTLPDPEVEVAYLIGTPNGNYNRTDIDVRQQLDWGVLLGRRRKLATAQNNQANAAYRIEFQRIMGEADEALTRVIYFNRQRAELTQRLETANELLALYEKKFARGEATELEVNKVRLNTAVSRAELTRVEADRTEALATLERLNGGKAVETTDTVYPQMSALPTLAEMQAAAANAPAVSAAQLETETLKAEAKLAKTETLPALTVGFMGEYVKENNFSGLSVGLSIPLWGNGRKKARAAQAMATASELTTGDLILNQRATIAKEHESARRLLAAADSLNQSIRALTTARLLRRSLELGQISVIDYLLESSFYYSARTAQLEAERDAQLALSRLRTLTLFSE